MAVQLRQEYKDVQFENGCFKVTREDAQLPIYIVGISTSLNEKRYDAKYVVPNVQAR